VAGNPIVRVSPHALLAALWLAAAAPGATSLRFEVTPESGSPPSAKVTVEGQLVVRLRHPQAGIAAKLAQLVAARLHILAERGTGPDDFTLVKVDDGLAVYADGERLITANASACELAKQTPESLASSWLRFLKMAFERDYLSVPSDELLLPVNEPVSMVIRGRPATLPATAASQPAGITATAGTSGISLVAPTIGDYTLRLTRGAAMLDLPVRVRRRAGRLREPIDAAVTGRNVPGELLRQAVETAIVCALEREPGTQLTLRWPTHHANPRPDSDARIAIGVRVAGSDLVPLDQVAEVTVKNLTWPDQPADWLLVSNAPESVAAPGLLLRGRVPEDARTRLLYHHQTVTAGPLAYEVRLVNPTEHVALVHVRNASAGPSYAEVAGHKAAVRYWQQRLEGLGAMLELPPRSSYTIDGAVCPRNQVWSGLSELTPMDGALELQVVATTGSPRLGLQPFRATAQPFHDEFTFAKPDKTVSYRYEPGTVWAFMNIGRDPVPSVSGPVLLGNYGVVYDLDLTYHNSTTETQRYELVFSADGGSALGTLLVDGRLYETGMVQGGDQWRLLDFPLPPGRSRRLAIRTLPESASNYPLRLVGRPYHAGWSGRGRP